MKNYLIIFVLMFWRIGYLSGQTPVNWDGISRPVNTFSIVAMDPETGQFGVAVQSHWFSVGPIVPWAEAGVGAVATQSFVDVSYGPLGLALMKAGKTAREALNALIEADKNPEIRQVAMIDSRGNVAVHTGKKNIQSAGHQTGKYYSVQGNLLLNNDVWPAMAQAFERTNGDFADRLIAALEAGQKAGGDIRGRQSASILIVRGKSTGKPWEDVIMDLRVEDSEKPIQELKRLVKLHKAYEHMNNGDLAVEQGDNERALREYGWAEKLYPENLEMKFWHAVALVNMDRVKESLPLFDEIFKKNRNWETLIPRLVDAGLLPKDEKVVRLILSVSNRKR
jgi:uncharacterized Ntn-hydrolase superfamily protein